MPRWNAALVLTRFPPTYKDLQVIESEAHLEKAHLAEQEPYTVRPCGDVALSLVNHSDSSARVCTMPSYLAGQGLGEGASSGIHRDPEGREWAERPGNIQILFGQSRTVKSRHSLPALQSTHTESTPPDTESHSVSWEQGWH